LTKNMGSAHSNHDRDQRSFSLNVQLLIFRTFSSFLDKSLMSYFIAYNEETTNANILKYKAIYNTVQCAIGKCLIV